jgi:hypothetical protein
MNESIEEKKNIPVRIRYLNQSEYQKDSVLPNTEFVIYIQKAEIANTLLSFHVVA